jgi:hypothetical protein
MQSQILIFGLWFTYFSIKRLCQADWETIAIKRTSKNEEQLCKNEPGCCFHNHKVTPFHMMEFWTAMQVVQILLCVTVSPSPQPRNMTDWSINVLQKYAHDFRCQHTTDAQDFDWGSDDEDRGLAIGRLVVT